MFNLSEYTTVAERIKLFWVKFPDGKIVNKSGLSSFDDLSDNLSVRVLDPEHFNSLGDCGVFGQIKHLGSLELVGRI